MRKKHIIISLGAKKIIWKFQEKRIDENSKITSENYFVNQFDCSRKDTWLYVKLKDATGSRRNSVWRDGGGGHGVCVHVCMF